MRDDVVDWLRLLEQENVRFVILDRRADRDLVEMLERQRGWAVDFEDQESVIFARRSR